MKQIPLSQDLFALVDDEDFEYLSQFKWWARWDQKARAFYASRVIYLGKGADGKYHNTSVNMHREVMRLPKGDKRRVDHRTPGDTLNNQKSNLRLSTPGQNRANSRLNQNNKAGLKGIHKVYNKWHAAIRVNGKRIYLGSFSTPEEAHNAYKSAAARYHGEFAHP